MDLQTFREQKNAGQHKAELDSIIVQFDRAYDRRALSLPYIVDQTTLDDLQTKLAGDTVGYTAQELTIISRLFTIGSERATAESSIKTSQNAIMTAAINQLVTLKDTIDNSTIPVYAADVKAHVQSVLDDMVARKAEAA